MGGVVWNNISGQQLNERSGVPTTTKGKLFDGNWVLLSAGPVSLWAMETPGRATVSNGEP